MPTPKSNQHRSIELVKGFSVTLIQPLITVIIPVYNGGLFIKEALESIFNQTYRPLEVLVVNDGSTDCSGEIAGSIRGVDVLHKPHTGIAETLNHGIRHAKGDLFAFLDADDLWLAEKSTLQVAGLQDEPSLDMVFGYARQFFTPGLHNHTEGIFSEKQPAIHESAMLIRRESFFKVGFFDVEETQHHFLDWYARSQKIGLSMKMLSDVVVERRIHDQNYGRIHREHQRHQYLGTLRNILIQRRQK